MSATLATISGYHGLITAMRARKDALGMSDKDLDALCDWEPGTSSKYLSRGAKKTLGPLSMGKILRGLGLDLLAVENLERTVKLREFFTPRAEGQVRYTDMLHAAKHPVITVEFTRQHMKKLQALSAKSPNRPSPKRRRAIARNAANKRWSTPQLIEITGEKS